MALTSILRTVYSSTLNENLKKNLVYTNLANTTWNPDFSNAKSVVVNTIGPVSVGSYSGTVSFNDLASTSQTITLDQEKYFAVTFPRTNESQTNIDLMTNVLSEAAYAVGDTMDQFIAGFHADITTASVSGSLEYGDTSTPIAVKDSPTTGEVKAYDAIVKLATKLNKANAPKNDRFVVVPFDMLELLNKDSRFTLNYNVLSNGIVEGAKIAGLTILASNNVPVSSSKYKVIAASKSAIAFGAGLSWIEELSPEASFNKAVKGLYVYGAKLIQPSAAVVGTFTF